MRFHRQYQFLSNYDFIKAAVIAFYVKKWFNGLSVKILRTSMYKVIK